MSTNYTEIFQVVMAVNINIISPIYVASKPCNYLLNHTVLIMLITKVPHNTQTAILQFATPNHHWKFWSFFFKRRVRFQGQEEIKHIKLLGSPIYLQRKNTTTSLYNVIWDLNLSWWWKFKLWFLFQPRDTSDRKEIQNWLVLFFNSKPIFKIYILWCLHCLFM